MKNNTILISLLAVVIFFSSSCNSNKEIKNKFKELIKLEQKSKKWEEMKESSKQLRDERIAHQKTNDSLQACCSAEYENINSINNRMDTMALEGEEPQDSTDLTTEDAYHRTFNANGSEAGGDTKMTMYEADGDIFVGIQNRTGDVINGFTLWNDTYKLNFNGIFKIDENRGTLAKSENPPIGIGGTISKSKEGTHGINYEIKFYPKDSFLRIKFYGSGNNKWYQVGDFYFKHPEKALTIVESMQSNLK